MRLIALLSLAAGILLAATFGRYLALRPLSGGRLFEVNPSLLGLAVLSGLAAVVTYILALPNVISRPGMAALTMTFLVASSLGTPLILIASLSPMTVRSPDSTLFTEPPRPPDVLLTIEQPLYFANGAHELSPAVRDYYGSVLAAANGCPGVTVVVRGYASSRPFRNDPLGQKNLGLANNRADTIAAMIRGAGIKNVRPEHWPNLGNMEAARGIDDRDTAPRSKGIRELLNRRADMSIALGPECHAEPAK